MTTRYHSTYYAHELTSRIQQIDPRMIEEMGYHRRDGDVRGIEQQSNAD